MFNIILLTIFVCLFSWFTWHKFQNGLILFFLLLPTYLIRFQIGFLPTTLLEIMFGIIFIIWIIKYRRSILSSLWSSTKKYPVFFIATLLFLLAATISVFTSIDTRSALGEWKAFYVEPVIIFIILITALKEDKKTQNLILFSLITSGLLTSLLAIYQHFTGWMVPEAFWSNQNTYRVTAWYGFPNAVGMFLAPLIPLAIYGIKQILTKSKNNSKYLFLIPYSLFLILSSFAIVFAKSTGALIGLIGGIGLLLLLNKKTKWPTLAIGIISVISLFFLPQLSNIKQEIFFGDRSGQIRLTMWQNTFDFLKDNPIAGAGLASYSEKIVPYHTTVNGEGIEIFHHPHNILLTMWVNLGILGLLSFTVITIYSLFFIPYYLYKQKKQIPPQNLFMISSLVTILIMGLVDSPYIKNDLAMFFWLLIALILNNKYDLENTTIKKIS